ncbi:MAG: hypothetical protein HY883_02010 [Deltaproteobacteria bacterium]|nr:hypothetical protein [Deltaproteobacteria bacterium]
MVGMSWCANTKGRQWSRVKNLLLAAFIFQSLLSLAYSEEEINEWEIADLHTKRLSPTAFAGLPDDLVMELQARGCTIPQVFDNPTPHNIIHGEFLRMGQTDWAALCSKGRISSILIFWDGSPDKVSEIASEPDKRWLQGIGDGQTGFSREIRAIGKKEIMDYHRLCLDFFYEYIDCPEPPQVDHQGIEDIFVNKASGILYFYDGKWLQLSGAD